MTERLIRRIFSYVGVNNLSDEDVLSFCRSTKLDRLPPHLIIVLGTCLPLIELAIKRLMNETIEWGDLEDRGSGL
jgi:hypothetical protein